MTYSLSQHTPEVSAADLVLSRDYFPSAREGDILEIRPEEGSSPFVLQLTAGSFVSGKGAKISVSKAVSTAFNLPGRDCLVRIQGLSSRSYEIEAIVFSIKDQYLSRRDLSKIERCSASKAFYRFQKTTLQGAKLLVTDILVGGKPATSGVFTGKTMVTFRSKSCRAVWLLEMSQEMWVFTSDGYLLLERALWFIRCALERSVLMGVSHNISIVVFSRLYYPKVTAEEAALHKLCTSPEGLYYLDICKEICEIGNLRLSLKSAFPGIKRELFTFMQELNWAIDVPSIALHATKGNGREVQRLPGRLASSREVCLLETVNIALNRFEYHAQDRKLVNTGQCILAISAGVGAYQATPTLVKLTKERITNSAVIFDIVSVNQKPLHQVPVFVYSLERLRERRDRAREAVDKETYELYLNYSEAHPAADKGISRPTWLRLHFFSSVAHLEGALNIQSALHTMALTRTVAQPTVLTSLSCFEKPLITSLSHVNSKLSYSLKDAVADSKVLTGIQTEVESPLIGVQPQNFDQIAMKSNLQAFCRAFDDRIFSVNKEEEVRFDLQYSDKRKLDRFSAGLDHRGFRGTMVAVMEPSYSVPPPDGMQRKYSETSSEMSKETDSPRRNSIHDLTVGRVVRNSQANPFLGKSEMKRFSRFTRRWARLFPGTVPVPPDTVDSNPFCEKSLLFFESVWRLLLEPALLPLTSDFWPGNEELGSSNPTQTSISPSCPLQKDTLVRELVGLRLQKEFQLVTHPIDRLGRKVHLNPNAHYLSRGRSDHVILPSLQDDYNVDFRIYTSKHPPAELHYTALVYSSVDLAYVPKEFLFEVGQTDWNPIDSIVLGYTPKSQLPLTDITKCIKLVLLPRAFHGVDRLSEADEAQQMEDFAAFHRLLQEALNREQQKASGDDRDRVDIEVISMRKPQETMRKNSFVLRFEEPEEWITIEHDAIIKPNFAFSIRITWICGMGPAVAERVYLMKRKAEQAGVALVQVPLWDGYHLKSPFKPQLVLRVVQMDWMKTALQSSLVEMLEMSPDLHIHRTGAAIVRLAESQLVFQENYMIGTEEGRNCYFRLVATALAHEVLLTLISLL